MGKVKIQTLLQNHEDQMFKVGSKLIQGLICVDDYEDEIHNVFTASLDLINGLADNGCITTDEAADWKVRLLNKHTIDLRATYHTYFTATARGKKSQTRPGVK